MAAKLKQTKIRMKQRNKLRVKWALEKHFSRTDCTPPPFFLAKSKKENEEEKSFNAGTIKKCHQCQNVTVLRASRIQNF